MKIDHPYSRKRTQDQARDQERLYHVARARAELDSAYRTATAEASERHMQLCTLHLRQARLHRAPLTGSAAREHDWLQHLAHFHARCLGSHSPDIDRR